MATVKEIYKFIDSFAPFDKAESYDNVGILVGNPDSKVTKAIVTLDITSEVVKEAAAFGAEVVISHHPIIFNPLKKVLSNSAVYHLIGHNISAICAHTNLDKSPVFGVNTELARAMELANIGTSENNDILFLGNTKKTFTSEEFASVLKKNLDCESFPFTKINNNINKVGLCSGAGGSEIFSAIGESCDAFVTGELKHHELLAANESGVSVFVLGHYKSEDIVIQPLCGKLSERFEDIEFVKSKVFNDGITYISVDGN